MTFAVTINDSPRYVVHARGVFGAIMAALETPEALGGILAYKDAVRIEVTPIPSKDGKLVMRSA